MLSLQTHLQRAVHAWKDRLSCTARECRGKHRLLGRLSDTRGSIQLEGQRYCFPTCFEQEIHRRFYGIWRTPDARPRPPHRVPLGLLMLSRGDLTEAQLRESLAAQRQNGGRVGDWIQKLGFAKEQQVTAALATQWGCPILRTLPPTLASCAIPFQLLRRLQMVPVSYSPTGRVLHVAFAAEVEYRALLAIEHVLECRAEPCMANATALREVLLGMEQENRGADQAFEHAGGPEEMTRITSSYVGILGADRVRLAGCAEFTWVRIESTNNSANLLFRQAKNEIFSASMRRPLNLGHAALQQIAD